MDQRSISANSGFRFDRLELLLPVGGRYLEWHVDGRFGRGLLVGYRLDGPRLLDGVGDGDVVGKFLAVLRLLARYSTRIRRLR
jgi:hypothetical protein